MESFRPEALPARVVAGELVSSRYDGLYVSGVLPGGGRPADWSLRRGGADVIRDASGRLIKLFSGSQQSPPGSGWILILRRGDPDRGYEWTLHGFSAEADVPADGE